MATPKRDEACGSQLAAARLAVRTRLLFSPARRDEAAFAVPGHGDFLFVKVFAVPQFAGDLAVALVERFAIVCVEAKPHFPAAA